MLHFDVQKPFRDNFVKKKKLKKKRFKDIGITNLRIYFAGLTSFDSEK